MVFIWMNIFWLTHPFRSMDASVVFSIRLLWRTVLWTFGTHLLKHRYGTDLRVKLLSNRTCSALVVNAKWFFQIVDQFIFLLAKCKNFVFILAIVISTQWNSLCLQFAFPRLPMKLRIFFFLFTDHLDVFF